MIEPAPPSPAATADGHSAIRARGLVKRYGEVTAVGGIDFTVPRGATTALLGGNGAGEVEILGVDNGRDRYAVLPQMSFSSPYVELPHRLTVRENLVSWGFIPLNLMHDSTWVAQAFGVPISGVLLWDVLFRGQLGMSISFLEVLPVPLQWIALALPPAHVFEGMRSVLFGNGIDWGRLVAAVALNGLCLVLGSLVFLHYLGQAHRSGALLQQGE